MHVDPLRYDAGDFNLFRFVGNGPVGDVDPSGLSPDAWHKYKRGVERREAIVATDGSIKTQINEMAFPCQKAKDKVYSAVMELVKIARQRWSGMTGFFGDCEKWQQAYLLKMENVIARLRKEGIVGCAFEVDAVSWTNDFTGGLAGHAAIRLQFMNGKNFYLDDGNKGGLDQVFVDDELPNWRYSPDAPAKALFILDYGISAKCKKAKTCLDHLCD